MKGTFNIKYFTHNSFFIQMRCQFKLLIIILQYSAPQGFKCDDLIMSFKSVFQDVRNAVDYVHMQVRKLISRVL